MWWGHADGVKTKWEKQNSSDDEEGHGNAEGDGQAEEVEPADGVDGLQAAKEVGKKLRKQKGKRGPEQMEKQAMLEVPQFIARNFRTLQGRSRLSQVVTN